MTQENPPSVVLKLNVMIGIHVIVNPRGVEINRERVFNVSVHKDMYLWQEKIVGVKRQASQKFLF